jgi:hypothetical protein
MQIGRWCEIAKIAMFEFCVIVGCIRVAHYQGIDLP